MRPCISIRDFVHPSISLSVRPSVFPSIRPSNGLSVRESGFLSSGPDRGLSPVEWGDFPNIHLFVCLYFRPLLQAIQPGLRPSQPASQASGFRHGWPIGAAALPSPMKTKKKVEQGKGTADHLMPLGYLLIFFASFILFF